MSYINFEKVGFRQEHKEHCSAYFAAYYNSVTNSTNKAERVRTPAFSNRWANKMQSRVTIMTGRLRASP